MAQDNSWVETLYPYSGGEDFTLTTASFSITVSSITTSGPKTNPAGDDETAFSALVAIKGLPLHLRFHYTDDENEAELSLIRPSTCCGHWKAKANVSKDGLCSYCAKPVSASVHIELVYEQDLAAELMPWLAEATDPLSAAIEAPIVARAIDLSSVLFTEAVAWTELSKLESTLPTEL